MQQAQPVMRWEKPKCMGKVSVSILFHAFYRFQIPGTIQLLEKLDYQNDQTPCKASFTSRPSSWCNGYPACVSIVQIVFGITECINYWMSRDASNIKI